MFCKFESKTSMMQLDYNPVCLVWPHPQPATTINNRVTLKQDDLLNHSNYSTDCKLLSATGAISTAHFQLKSHHVLPLKKCISYCEKQRWKSPCAPHIHVYGYNCWKWIIVGQKLMQSRLNAKLTTVIIICSWNIFSWEAIRCVADHKGSFAHSTITNQHTFDSVVVTAFLVRAMLHWYVPQLSECTKCSDYGGMRLPASWLNWNWY